jgi:hypothetical protein
VLDLNRDLAKGPEPFANSPLERMAQPRQNCFGERDRIGGLMTNRKRLAELLGPDDRVR